MCTGLEPFVVPALLGAAGISAAGKISQGIAAKNQADFQAKIAEQQADSARLIAGQEESDSRRAHRRLLAERRAAMGAGGFEMGTGSPLLAVGDFASEAELNARRIRSGGQARQTRLEQQADLQRQAGRSARTRGFARAGASLLRGFTEASQF